ncbi:MAG: hypothetical protein IPM96_21765 [Ignavibacteria bacterium]|nr:hypothetical protein [Ignavibacteria bacterium]
METRGDKLYSVTNTQKYVKLHFTRPMNFPNKEKFEQLQNEYFGYNFAEKNGYKGAVYLVLFGLLFWIITACSSSALQVIH